MLIQKQSIQNKYIQNLRFPVHNFMSLLLQNLRFLQIDQDQIDSNLDFHGSPLIISWLVIGNLTIIVAVLRWWKYSFFLHMVFGLVITGLTLAAVIPMLKIMWMGDDTTKNLLNTHALIGFIVVVWLGVQVLSGFLARFIQFPAFVGTRFNLWTKRVHYISSYGILLLAKSNYLNIKFIDGQLQGSFIILILIDLACFGFYLFLKFKYWTLSENIVDNQLLVKDDYSQQNIIKKGLYAIIDSILVFKNQLLRQKFNPPKTQKSQIFYASENQIKLNKYVIFNDHVYDIEPFVKWHPGGQYVMTLVNNRQVDRFLYGMYAHELTPNVSPHSHSKDSLDLCGQSSGKIVRTSPMTGWNGHFKALIQSCTAISDRSCTYVLNIKPDFSQASQNFNLSYRGFTKAEQLGQYFSLTITNDSGKQRCTRLYTTVWSQRVENIQMMEKLYPGSTSYKYTNKVSEEIQLKQIKVQQGMTKSDIQLAYSGHSGRQMTKHNSDRAKNSSIPLVIKRYQTGQLTSQLLSQKFDGSIIMSEPMGCGMKYQNIGLQGKVLIVCGGTGVLPFCDFIDILFKRAKHLQNGKLQFVNKDPLVDQDLIKNRQFILYCAAESYFDLPALSIYQINELCASTVLKFKASFRLSKMGDLFTKQYPNISTQKQYFDTKVKKALIEDICQIYICGPPSMNTSMAKLISQNNVNQQLYHFI